MKRVALGMIAIMMIAASLLLLEVGAVVAADPDLARQLAELADSKLSDSQLAAVSGRGVPREGTSPGTTGVIIWDEPPGGKVISHHSSTGQGGTQTSTISVRGR